MPTSDKIKEARASLGETQAEFGLRFGVDQSTIHRWETNGVPERGVTRMAVESVLGQLPKREPAEATQ